MSKSQRISNSWKTKEGTLIYPGDKVFAFVRCTGQVSVHFGEYLGYTNSREPRVQVAIQDTRTVAYEKGSSIPYNYRDYYAGVVPFPTNLVYVSEPYTRVTTLNLNRIYPADGMTAEKLAKLV